MVLSTGERLPMLMRRADGLPLFYPNVYAMAEVRGRDSASNTIEQALRAVMVLQLFLDAEGIDLQARLREGRFLERGEIEGLAQALRTPIEDLIMKAVAKSRKDAEADGNVVSFDAVYARRKADRATVGRTTSSIRCTYIRSYLMWLSTEYRQRLSVRDPAKAVQLQQSAEFVDKSLLKRQKKSGDRNAVFRRKGLSAEARALLLEVIDPACKRNPWRQAFARKRNALVVRMLLLLGLRRGELLNIRVEDVDFRQGRILIARRPDDSKRPANSILDRPRRRCLTLRRWPRRRAASGAAAAPRSGCSAAWAAVSGRP